MNVYFTHGKESGPWGTKIDALAKVARMKGFSVESPDYSKQPDPDARVEQLFSLQLPTSDLTVLVGSSMGGYVATVASQIVNPVGLFLMAPAFFIPGYKEQSPIPHAKKTVIVHGLKDDVVPVDNSVRFAREHNTELHLIDSDHRLDDQLPMIEMLFARFLDDVVGLCELPKNLTYEEVAQKLGRRCRWIELIWDEMVSAGHANYTNDFELNNAYLRFNVLANFYNAFLTDFERDAGMIPPQDLVDNFDLPQEFLDGLLADLVARRGCELKEAPDIKMVMEEIGRIYVYPVITAYSGADIKRVSALLLHHSDPLDNNGDTHSYSNEPEDFEEGASGYITDPEDPDKEGLSEEAVLDAIKKWLAYKFKTPS